MQEGSQAMFYCDQEIPWGSLAAEGGVKLATSNRCHLFCDMVTTIATPHLLLLVMQMSAK